MCCVRPLLSALVAPIEGGNRNFTIRKPLSHGPFVFGLKKKSRHRCGTVPEAPFGALARPVIRRADRNAQLATSFPCERFAELDATSQWAGGLGEFNVRPTEVPMSICPAVVIRESPGLPLRVVVCFASGQEAAIYGSNGPNYRLREKGGDRRPGMNSSSLVFVAVLGGRLLGRFRF